MSWFADSMVNRPPRTDEEGLIVRPIFSGSDGSSLPVQKSSVVRSSVSSYSSSSFLVSSGSSSRAGMSLYNMSSKPLYVMFGQSASTAAFSVRMPARSLYELPSPVYTGDVYAVGESGGSGSVMVTEFS